MTKRALVILTHGFEDIEAVAPLDVLNRVGVEVRVVALEPGVVCAAYGTRLVPDMTIDQVIGLSDAVILPGGKQNALSLAADSRVIELVCRHAGEGKLVSAICASPSHVLGEAAGVLYRRRATGDPGFNEKLAACGAILTHEPVTCDGNIITGMGPGAALAYALHLAAYLAGSDAARVFAYKWGVRL